MKPNSLNLFVVLLTLLGAIDALAQGTVYLNNYALSACGTGLKAPVYAPEPGNITLSKTGNTTSGLPAGTQTYSGALLSGSTYRAQLYGAAGYGRLETDLVAATPATTFRTGAAAGYLTAVTATIPGTAEGGSATVQMRVWDNTSGLYPDWASAETAWNLGLIAAGKAPLIFASPLGGVSPPAYLCGLVSFNLYYQPVAPSVQTQPTNQLPALGELATFSVVADGTPTLSYQWRLNTTPISGATTNPFTLPSAQLTDSGSYTVVITNTYGKATSEVATLWIPPAFTVQPTNKTVTVGSNATFTANATGSAPLRFQWQLNGIPIAGTSTSRYTVNNAQLTNAGSYTMVATNLGGWRTSEVATLTVGVPASILAQPTDQAVAAGQTAYFFGLGTGTDPLAYQWCFNGNPLPGATSSGYSRPNVGAPQAGSYTLVLTNLYGSATSQVAMLTILPQTNLTWTGVGATAYWNNTANWTPAGRGVGMGDTLIFPDLANRRVNTNDLDNFTFNAIRFTGTNDAYQLSGNALTLTNAILANSNSVATNFIYANITLATTNVQADIQTNAHLVLAGVLSGSGGFVKNGSGTLTLSGTNNNTYQGPTVVNEGLVELNKTNALAISAGSLTVGDGIGGYKGDVVRSTGSDNQLAETLPVTLYPAGLLDLNGRTDHVGNMALYEGGVDSGTGLLRATGDISGSGFTAGRLEFMTSPATIDVTGTIYFGAQISGDEIIKKGQGLLHLGGSNSYSGLTIVQEGGIKAGNSWALGSTNAGTVVCNGAAIHLGGHAITNESLILNGPDCIIYGGVAKEAYCVWAGPITLNGSCTAEIRYNIEIDGPISGDGALQIQGTVALEGPLVNTYRGSTRVSGYNSFLWPNKSVSDGAIPHDLYIGTDSFVVLLAANQIANSALVDIQTNGLFDLNGHSETIDRLTGTGNVNVGGGMLTVGAANGNSTFDGVISGNGYLRKLGTGTLTLTGANTYSGGTQIAVSNLVVNGSADQCLADVWANGVLSGHGTVGHISAAGTVAPGPGVLSCSNLTLRGSPRFAVTLRGVGPVHSDQLNVRGTCDLGGAALVVSTAAVHLGDTFIILNKDGTDPVTSRFAGLQEGAQFTADNIGFGISYFGGDGNDVVLTVTGVPGSAVGNVVTGGNGDHIVNRQECNDLLVSLVNTSSIPMSGITATLSTTTAGALITQPYSAYPDLPAGFMAVNVTPFQLSTLPNMPSRDIDLQLTLRSASHGGFTVPLKITRGPEANNPGSSVCYPCLEPLTGTITQTNPAEVGRIAPTPQLAACGAPKAWPGKTGIRISNLTWTNYHYATHTFTNTTGADACVTVEVYSADDLQAVAYLDSFDPVNIEANYIGDGGYSTGAGGGVSAFSCHVPAGARWAVIVNETVEHAGSTGYQLYLYGLPCGQPMLHADPAPANSVRVYWPTAFGGYLLESAPSLTNSTWTLVPEQPIVSDAAYNVTNLADQPARFYRLTSAGNSQASPPGMALIPAGPFTMGNCMDPREGDTDELPLHDVFVSAFYMDRTEVTKALWDEVKAWNGGNGYDLGTIGLGKAANHPVHTVSWYDAVKWCNARSQKEGLTPCYYTDAGLSQVYKTLNIQPYVNWSANGYRLPTEAEWEKAARGGAPGHRFPWSYTENIAHSNANYWSGPDYPYETSPTRGFHPDFDDLPLPYTSPVGYFAANGYGLYDMAGNVFEWCWDWYDGIYYSSSPETNPRGPASSPLGYRVFRGGDWHYVAFNARCALRGARAPSDAGDYYGFRCVRGL